jgi:hypothetical protein
MTAAGDSSPDEACRERRGDFEGRKSMPNTTYTMSNIKSYVDGLKCQSLKEYKEKMTVHFEAHLEADTGIMADISRHESMCQEAERLEKKYDTSGWVHRYSQDLKSVIKTGYFKSREDEVQKRSEEQPYLIYFFGI